MASESQPVRVVVEITRAEPLRGTVSEHGQPVQPFSGWMAFAAAIATVVRRIGAIREAGDPDEDGGG